MWRPLSAGAGSSDRGKRVEIRSVTWLESVGSGRAEGETEAEAK